MTRYQGHAGYLLIFIILLFITAKTGVSPDLTEWVELFNLPLILIGLACSTLLLYKVIVHLIDAIKRSFYKKRELWRLHQFLANLSKDEKYVLSLYIDYKTAERELDPNKSSVALLEVNNVLVYVGPTEDRQKKKYKISPFAQRALLKNPKWLL